MGANKERVRVSLLGRFNRAVTTGLRSFVESPWVKFTTGAVLLTSGLDEAIETLFADLSALKLGAHHGVMLLGFVNLLSALPDMLDGLVGTVLIDEDEEDASDSSDDAGEPQVLPITTAAPAAAPPTQTRRAA